MRRFIPSIFVVILFFVACENVGVLEKDPLFEPYDLRINKVTENQSQFAIYHYDDDLWINKYEFGSQVPGDERITIYADYFYQNNRLSKVEQFVLVNEQYEKTSIEEYDYNGNGRLTAIRYHSKSEVGINWHDSMQQFFYDDQNRVIKTVYPGHSEDHYFYDENGNVSRVDHYLEGTEYDGPLMRNYTYDTKKNPYYLRHEYRRGGVLYLSPNNVVGWENISPISGEVVSSASIVYQYNAENYPVKFTQTVLSPLTDPQPGVEASSADYEYIQ